MNNNSARFLRSSLIGGDLLVVNVAFVIGYLIKFKSFAYIQSDKYFALFLVFNSAWLISAYFLKTYDQERIIDFDNYAFKIIRICLTHTLLIAGFWVARKAFYYSREQLLWSFLILYPLLFVWRGIFFYLIKRYRKSGKHYRGIIVVGAGELADQLVTIFKRNMDYGYKVLGVFGVKAVPEGAEFSLTGKPEDVPAFLESNKVDEMYCSAADLSPDQVKELTELADKNIIRFRLLPDVRGVGYKRLSMDFFEHLPILSLRNLPLDDRFNRMLKRAFDLVFSSLVIVLIMSWLFPLLALLIRLSSPGPILFRQRRSGLNNEEFNCLKFRSMRVNKDADKLQAVKGDARITGIGRFIRKTSLDEFPQFFNVFAGQMSVVGPRPHMLKHTAEYSKIIDKYMVRHFVKPGITGLAQVKGFRGETKTSRQMEGRIRLDMLYVESWSLLLDLWIVLRTAINVFLRTKEVH